MYKYVCELFFSIASMDNIVQIMFIIMCSSAQFGTLLCEIRTNLLISMKDTSLGNVLLDCQKSSTISCINECMRYEPQCQAASYHNHQGRCLLHPKHPLNTTVQPMNSFGFNLYYSEHGECDDGWYKFNRKCYFFNMDSLTWDNAMASCVTLRSTLVMIDDTDENEFLRTKCKEIGGHTYWTGAKYFTMYGEYRWYDGTPLNFKDWYPGDPDSSGCVDLLDIYDFHWNDHSDCNALLTSICERGLFD